MRDILFNPRHDTTNLGNFGFNFMKMWFPIEMFINHQEVDITEDGLKLNREIQEM